MDRAQAGVMRLQLLAATLLLVIPVVACTDASDGPSPYDDEFPVSDDNVNEGAPANDTLSDDNKADAVYPVKYEIGDQSPVKSQGSRGVCSIFATTALVENLYIKAGMPVADADFSEQYMQWSVKNQIGTFANTEGSSGDANLKSVVRFGTVKEGDWVYETAPWTASNDAACTGGENLPTKCYTNGEPPASATSATKFKLPSSRWINNNSIKAHLTGKKTGVIVGFTFFYQSWNHRRSELPISTPLWQKGVVTYPNAKDKEVSLVKRAGHAIEIVGWDDEIAFDMRDGEGNPVKDAQGNVLKEKGYWIFKNSWGTASFGVDHPTGAGYGYLSMKYVAEFGSAVTAELPSLTPAREVCDDTAMADEDGDGKKNCADTDCAASPACSTNNTAHTYTGTGGAIPDNSPTGVSSTIAVSDTGTLTDVKVTVDITHTYRGDLTVSLSHGAVTKVLVAGVGGSADDLKQTFTVTGLTGAALAGGWTLKVEDTAGQDVGTLNSWVLETTTN
ncbi:MAG: proprotein convertase P-domain-containing protein [Deltaproteobacteria bacterium]|nr:proprotein convertase P-domain-containing protein [Deltaproteobacteria bacterium]